MANVALINLARWEWFRFRRRPALWVVVGLVLAGAVAQLGVQAWLIDGEGGASSYRFPGWVMVTAGEAGPLLAVALAAAALGGDFGSGVWRALVARGIPRWQAALSKLLVVSLALNLLLAGVWILAAVVGLAVGVGAEPAGGAMPTLPDDGAGGWGAAVGSLGAVGLTLVAYAGLGAALTVAGRATAFGLGIGIAIILFESLIYPLAGFIADAAWGIALDDYTRWTLWGATRGLIRGDDDLSAWAFLGPTVAYAALCWGLALVILERRDVDSGRG